MRWALLVAIMLIAPDVRAADEPKDKPQDVPLSELGEKFQLIGKLGVPLGESVTVQGVVVSGPFKGYEGGPNLRVQRINGKATQEYIQIRLLPYFGEFDDLDDGFKLPAVTSGMTFEFEGYQTGEFVGAPRDAYKKADVGEQTTDFYFLQGLIVFKAKRLETIVWSPADFLDQEALIEGKAVSRDKKAYIDGDGWKLLTDRAAGWSNDLEGKTVEGFGTVKKTDGGEYELEKGVTRLVKLEDQKGRAVTLRGTAWSKNGHWWFNYRGVDLYVEGMKELPGWTRELHGRQVVITGNLDEADLPDIRQIARKIELDKKKYFIVRKAEWKRLDALLSPERAVASIALSQNAKPPAPAAPPADPVAVPAAGGVPVIVPIKMQIWEYKVSDRGGFEPGAWEKKLNDMAKEGWQLDAIDEGHYILRRQMQHVGPGGGGAGFF